MPRIYRPRDLRVVDAPESDDRRRDMTGHGPPLLGSVRRSARGAVLWPCLAMLAVTMLACALVLGICGNSRVDAERLGGAIDILLTETLDTWLETDTLTLPGIRPEDLPFHDFFSSRMPPWGPVSPSLDRVWITIEAPGRETTDPSERPPGEGGPTPLER